MWYINHCRKPVLPVNSGDVGRVKAYTSNEWGKKKKKLSVDKVRHFIMTGFS